MSKRVLVTGGAGFVGSHFVEHALVNRPDWDLDLICDFTHAGVAERLTKVPRIASAIESGKVKVHLSNLTRPISKYLLEDLKGIDYIVNYASNSHVDNSLVDPLPFFQDNTSIMLNMLELSRQISPKLFVHSSTDEVYGPAHGDYKHKEWDVIAPSNPYSASKASQEAAAFAWWRAYNVPVIITNTMNIVGERQDSEKFVPMCIKKILAQEPLHIHAMCRNGVWEIGSRHYLHARNQADAVLFLIDKFADTFPYYSYLDNERLPRFHIVGELEVNNLDLALAIAKIIGKPLVYDLHDAHTARPGHDLKYALDGQKLHGLGWNPPVPFWDSLEKLVKFTIEHKEWLA